MREDTREKLTSRDIWIRALYMVLFIITYSIAEFILGCLVLFQFITILFTRRANEPLLKFGNNLSVYIFDVLQFQTFNSEDMPFPFADWPDEEHAGDRWLLDEDEIPAEVRQAGDSSTELSDEPNPEQAEDTITPETAEEPEPDDNKEDPKGG